ncbi:MAG TPA: 2-phosphosulfolactate phosphatase [Acidimicrobiales bacterium]|nr:2-phosphosulfolactate phosphatase [Acidimicrobiales bacterium]
MTGRDRAAAMPEWFDQDAFAVRFEWGPHGLRRLAPKVDVVVIVDVLRFTTCVDVAVGRGAQVLPYRWHDGDEAAFAEAQGAVLATSDDTGDGWSLSAAALASIPAGTRLVLPSANGSALSFGAAEAGAGLVVAACLRNASAVAAHLVADGGTVGVVAAGERWRGGTGPLRPAVEDLLGAGAVLAGLPLEHLSPEARAARAAFLAERDRLDDAIAACGSGRELAETGRGRDLPLAAALDASTVVPVLRQDRFVAG